MNPNVLALVAMPDNQHALSGAEDHNVKLFNVNDGAVLRTFTHQGHPEWGFASCLALLPDGLRFAYAGADAVHIVEHGLALP